MKKFLAFILFFQCLLWAATNAQVELNSGTRQKVQFIGIAGDTVQLGGFINNQFTVVRILKSNIKSLVDDNGKDLLAQDSSIAEAPKVLPSKVFIPWTSSELDQESLEALNQLTFSLLKKGDSTYVTLPKDSLSQCEDEMCLQQTLFGKGFQEINIGKISPAADSISLEINQYIYEDSLPTIHSTSLKLPRNGFLDAAISNNNLKAFIQVHQGIPVTPLAAQPKKDEGSQKTSGKGYIYVETDPEGATLSKPEQEAICKSPCTFAVQDTNKVIINAYWGVDKHLWGAQATIRPIPGDTAKVSLKLKRVSPEVKIHSIPTNAEIYAGSTEITKRSTPIGHTPDKISAFEPGMAKIKLRKPGYRDTTVQFYIGPVAETEISVDLQEIQDFEEIKEQNRQLKEKKVYNVGKALMGSAIGPALVGAIFAYLGHRDYSDAEDLKSELSIPGDPNGANFQSKVRKNKELVDSGDKKIIVSGSLLGVAAALLGVGIFLTF